LLSTIFFSNFESPAKPDLFLSTSSGASSILQPNLRGSLLLIACPNQHPSSFSAPLPVAAQLPLGLAPLSLSLTRIGLAVRSLSHTPLDIASEKLIPDWLDRFRDLVVDCGEGTYRQLVKFGFKTSRIDTIFITHMHGKGHYLENPFYVQEERELSWQRKDRRIS
jgi:hypothetical protein